MEPHSPHRKENENPDEDDAKKKKKESSGRKKVRIVAVFAIIEALSLVLEQKADDFSEPARYYIHWLSECGSLAGGAYIAHELFKPLFWRIICWIIWGITCLVILNLKSPPTADEDGNPIGMLLPANDPVPLKIPRGGPQWAADMMARDEGITNDPWLTLPPDVPNDFFIIMGGNFISLSAQSSIPLVRFHDKDFITLKLENNGASVSGEFFDKDQNIFALITNNEFTLDTKNFWRKKHPDKSTLIIISHQNTEILNIRFCRTNFFEISGIFNFPDGTQAIVTKTNWWYSRGWMGDANIMRGAGGLHIENNGLVSWGFPP